MDNLKKNKMIQAKELRIGNWIIDNGKQKQIYSISNHNARDYSKVKPIPITEEWLLKFGAVKYNGNRFYLDIKDTLQLFWNIGYDYFICEFSSRSTHVCYFNDIKYIHQLQNLYFALTQKELIFNG